MNVTPISMQMVVPQSTEAGQVQHNLNQAGALQQSFENVRQKEDARLKQQQVRNKDNPEDGRIKDDPEHRNKGSYAGAGETAPGSRKRKKSRSWSFSPETHPGDSSWISSIRGNKYEAGGSFH